MTFLLSSPKDKVVHAWLDAYCSEKTRQRMQRVLLHRKALLMHNFRRRRGSKHIANLFTNMLKR